MGDALIVAAMLVNAIATLRLAIVADRAFVSITKRLDKLERHDVGAAPSARRSFSDTF